MRQKVITLGKILVYLALGTCALMAIFPFLWLIMTAFKPRLVSLSLTPQWIFKPTLEHFPTAFIEKGFIKMAYNSLIVGFFSGLLSLFVGLPAAYSFSRFTMAGKKHLFFFILTTRMAPPVVFALPLYLIGVKLQLYDSYILLVIAHTTFNLALVVWIMKGFFDEVPRELDDAALVDGCSRFSAFTKVILPFALPAIIAIGIFSFIMSWNEFLFALVLTGRQARTLPVAIPGFVTVHGTYWGQLGAVSTIIALPVVVLSILLRKYFVRMFTFGVVKG